MTDENATGEKLDKLLTALDSINKRMDAMEGREAAAAKQRRADSRKRRADATEINEKTGEPMRPEMPQPVAADSKDDDMSDLPSKIKEAQTLRVRP